MVGRDGVSEGAGGNPFSWNVITNQKLVTKPLDLSQLILTDGVRMRTHAKDGGCAAARLQAARATHTQQDLSRHVLCVVRHTFCAANASSTGTDGVILNAPQTVM